MTAAKSDVLRKRLAAAGLSADACTKYVETLRAFLNARMTKSRYEDEMNKILPHDKIHVHNSIISDILLRAQQKRDGLPDLPLVKRPPLRRPAPNRETNGPQALKSKSSKVGLKRLREDTDNDARKAVADEVTQPAKKPKTKPTAPNKLLDLDKAVPTTKVKSTVEKVSPKAPPKRPKAPESAPTTPRTPAVMPTFSAPRAQTPRASSATHAVEIPTYEKLHFSAIQPGQNLDVDLFLKVRQRMRRIAVGEIGMAAVKDDSVTVMVKAIEQHVRCLLADAVRQRVRNDGVRPKGNLQCEAVRGEDFRHAGLVNTGLFGDESGMELERLLMLSGV